MKQVNIHKLWEKHTFPAIEKFLYKVHFACDHLFPMLALGSGFGAMLYGSPRGTWARRGEVRSHRGALGYWMHPFLTPPNSRSGLLHSTGNGPAFQGW